MMSSIYKKAKTVLVWLGKEEDVDANLAFDFMKSSYDSILLDQNIIRYSLSELEYYDKIAMEDLAQVLKYP